MPETKMDRAPLAYADDELLDLAGAVQELKDHPAWVTLGRILADALAKTREQGFEHPEDIQRWIGRAEGLQQAWDLPNDILKAAERTLKEERIRKEKPGPRRPRREADDDALTL